jgi:hypothetical protein
MEKREAVPVEQQAQKLAVPCCPELDADRACDAIDFHYRLIHNPTVVVNDRAQRVSVEVLIHVRLERCSGPLALGDLVYSTTLLPGEKVRLFTTDRRTRFTYDSTTELSYRQEQTSEERYYMAAMSDLMSDVTVRDESRATNQRHGETDAHGETSGFLSTIFSGPSVDVRGSYNAESTSEFFRELSQHAQASSHRSVEATRAASSVSVGEVQSRTHAEGESESHFESSSRTFSNPNRCHAVTYFLYQINKTQVIRFTIEAIRRRVIDPAADTRVTNNPFTSRGEVSVIPSAVLATDKDRLEVEQIGRASVAARTSESARFSSVRSAGGPYAAAGVSPAAFVPAQPIEPISSEVRAAALDAVDDDLAEVGLLDKQTGEVAEEARKQFSFVIKTSLPTPGLLVRGCLDECNVCEPTLRQEIKLELEHKRLKSEMLKRQIELLDKAQEYRCCPGEPATEETSDEA